MPSICQNLNSFTGHGVVSIWVKIFRVGQSNPNKQTNKIFLMKIIPDCLGLINKCTVQNPIFKVRYTCTVTSPNEWKFSSWTKNSKQANKQTCTCTYQQFGMKNIVIMPKTSFKLCDFLNITLGWAYILYLFKIIFRLMWTCCFMVNSVQIKDVCINEIYTVRLVCVLLFYFDESFLITIPFEIYICTKQMNNKHF